MHVRGWDAVHFSDLDCVSCNMRRLRVNSCVVHTHIHLLTIWISRRSAALQKYAIRECGKGCYKRMWQEMR
jgi:hypothetical protein